jgi:ribonuclease P/MRP protein subunit RPP40
MNNADLEVVTNEKDLGVVFCHDLSPTDHCTAAIAKASRVLATLRRSFTFMESDMFIPLYKTLIRPLLEYAAPAWSPSSRAVIDALERVQHRATKLVPSIRHLTYRERLQRLRLPTLIYRRVRGDCLRCLVTHMDTQTRSATTLAAALL